MPSIFNLVWSHCDVIWFSLGVEGFLLSIDKRMENELT